MPGRLYGFSVTYLRRLPRERWWRSHVAADPQSPDFVAPVRSGGQPRNSPPNPGLTRSGSDAGAVLRSAIGSSPKRWRAPSGPHDESDRPIDARFPRIAGSSSTASQSPSQRESKNRRGWPHAASTRRALAQAIHSSGQPRTTGSLRSTKDISSVPRRRRRCRT